MVDVHVRDGGRPVAGLTATDFDVRDNGVRQQIRAVTFEDVPVSLLLAFDVSTSVRGDARQFEERGAARRGGTSRGR
jgi:hypothetical protein